MARHAVIRIKFERIEIEDARLQFIPISGENLSDDQPKSININSRRCGIFCKWIFPFPSLKKFGSFPLGRASRGESWLTVMPLRPKSQSFGIHPDSVLNIN